MIKVFQSLNKFLCYLIDRSRYMKYLLPSTFTMKTINLANFQLSAITQITFQFLGRSSVLEQKEISITKMLSVTWTIVWFSSSTRLLNDKQFHYNSLKRRMLHQTNLRFVLFLSGCFNMTPQSISLTQAPYLLNSWFICVWTRNAINYLRKRILKWNFCTIISLNFFQFLFFRISFSLRIGSDKFYLTTSEGC